MSRGTGAPGGSPGARRFGGRDIHRNQGVIQCSKRTASNDLSELTAHGLLAVEGAGRAIRYRLAEPGP